MATPHNLSGQELLRLKDGNVLNLQGQEIGASENNELLNLQGQALAHVTASNQVDAGVLAATFLYFMSISE